MISRFVTSLSLSSSRGSILVLVLVSMLILVLVLAIAKKERKSPLYKGALLSRGMSHSALVASSEDIQPMPRYWCQSICPDNNKQIIKAKNI